jgi:hypothetical protein
LTQCALYDWFLALPANYADSAWKWCGNTVSSRFQPVTTLTTASLATEVLEGTLLTLERMSTRLTVLALNASRNPEQSPRFRMLLEDLLAGVQDCEEQLGTYAPLDA